MHAYTETRLVYDTSGAVVDTPCFWRFGLQMQAALIAHHMLRQLIAGHFHATRRLSALEKAEASGAWAPFSRIYAVLQPLGWDLLRTHLGPKDKATLALVEAFETLQAGAAWTGLQAQLRAEGTPAQCSLTPAQCSTTVSYILIML